MTRNQLLNDTPLAASAPQKPGQGADKTSSDRFWFELINEMNAADFIGLKPRTMQGYRYRGRGPPFVRLSARCVKYRRIDLLRWAEAHMRTSTSDTGLEAT